VGGVAGVDNFGRGGVGLGGRLGIGGIGGGCGRVGHDDEARGHVHVWSSCC